MPTMHCSNIDPAARVSGVDANTVVGIVYGTISITIASVQLFFEYQKYRFATHGGRPSNRIAWVERFQSVVLGMFGRSVVLQLTDKCFLGFVNGFDSRVNDYIC